MIDAGEILRVDESPPEPSADAMSRPFLSYRLPAVVTVAAALLLNLAVAASAAPTDELADPLPTAFAPPAWLPNFGAAPSAAPAPLAYTPTVWYSSYFAGSNGETLIKAIKVSAAGEIYIAGTTTSNNLPTTPGMGQNPSGGGSDGFIAKFAPDMRTPIYVQYVGSPLYDEINAIALDAAGNAYLAGYVYSSLSLRKGDALIAKVVYSGGSVTLGSDLIGGPNTGVDYAGDDEATDIGIQSTGTIVLAGSTTSTNFPGASGTLGGTSDGFIVLYDANLQRIRSRYVNLWTSDQIRAVDIGTDNFITVAGTTDAGSITGVHAWAVRLNPAATSIVWNRHYAGNQDDEANDVRVAGGQTYIVGRTNSTDYAVGAPIQPNLVGVNDGFLMRVSSADGLPDYSTYVGGPGLQRVRSVDVAENGDVLLCGITQPNADNDTTQVFLLRLNAPNLNSLDYSTQFGDPADADGIDTFLGRGDFLAMTRAPNKAIYVAGITAGSAFQPIAGVPYQSSKPNVFNAGFYMQVTNDDDFGGRFRLNTAAASVDEAAGTVTLTVERILSTINTETVQFATANGTATAPEDYTARSQTLTFPAGMTSQPITIPIINDGLDEDPETFTVTLSNPGGGATLGTLNTATVTITDNDNPPTLNLNPCSVNEGNSGGPVNCRFIARLTAVSGKDITFRTSTANGTGNAATAPSDYTAHTNITRTIFRGTQEIPIDVPVIADTTIEPDENFRLGFDQLVNANAGTATATGTIVNDDSAPSTNNSVFVSQSVPSLMYTGQTYPVTITLRNTGTTTWATANYRLGSQNPQNNTTWDADGRIALPSSVAPNATVTFSFNVVAPPTGGSYNFQWRMLQDSATWFGATTTNVAVIVVADRVFAGNFSAP